MNSSTDTVGMYNLTNVYYFRYEQEIHKRNDGENEFVMLKKVGRAAEKASYYLIGCMFF